MISKFSSSCKGCHGHIEAGEEIYWAKEAGSWHWVCFENRQPGAEVFALADKLGFLEHNTAMAANWPMRSLSAPLRSPAAGRPEPEAQRGSQPALFICGRGAKYSPCHYCAHRAAFQCDHPVIRAGKRTTYDTWMCEQCRNTAGTNVDLCRPHFNLWRNNGNKFKLGDVNVENG